MKPVTRLFNLTLASLLVTVASLPGYTETQTPTPQENRPPDATTLQALPGADRPGSDPLQLLQLEQVQKELALTPEQIAKLTQITQQARSQLNQRSRGLGQQMHNTAQQQQVLAQKADATRQQVAEVLNPEQLNRFRGVLLQVNGFTPELSSTRTRGNAPPDPLKLSPEQQEKLSAIRSDEQKAVGNALQATRTRGSTPANTCQQLEAIRSQRNQEMLSVLSKEQQATLEQMQGSKVELPARSCTP